MGSFIRTAFKFAIRKEKKESLLARYSTPRPTYIILYSTSFQIRPGKRKKTQVFKTWDGTFAKKSHHKLFYKIWRCLKCRSLLSQVVMLSTGEKKERN